MDNKIIFLIAPPRSLSTAFLRMMEQRHDLQIINEPASCVYYQQYFPNAEATYHKDVLKSYEAVHETIASSAKESSLFIKEMGFAFAELISAKPDLISAPNISHVFLLRNPHHCLISYYRKLRPELVEILLPYLEQLTGFEALYDSFKKVCAQAANKPLIIHAEDLISNSEQTVQALCEHIKLPHLPDSLHWKSLGDEFTGAQEWHEFKKREYTHHWHQDAIFSQGFHQPNQYEVDEHNNPRFSEIKNSEHRKMVRDVFIKSKPFYELMLGTRQKTIGTEELMLK